MNHGQRQLLLIAIATVKEVHLARIIRSPHFDWELMQFFKLEATHIVSLTAANCGPHSLDPGRPLIAIVVGQGQQDKSATKHNLYIYAHGTQHRSQNNTNSGANGAVDGEFDYLKQNPQILELAFIPSGVFHAEINGSATFFVVGNDNSLHAYSHGTTFDFKEVPISRLFPNLPHEFDSNVLCFDFYYHQDLLLVALGCRNGRIMLYLNKNGKSKSLTHRLDGPVSAIKFYSREVSELTSNQSFTQINLVVGCTIGYAVVYSDVARFGLQRGSILPSSDRHDSVLTVVPLRSTEIMIGTYGQRLLVYREEASASQEGSNSSQYELGFEKALGYPAYSICFGDFTQDGTEDMVVATLFGLHFFQSGDKVRAALQRRNEILQEIALLKQQLEGDGS